MWRYYLVLLAVPLIWSLNFILGKVLIDSLPPFTITASRFTVGGAFLGLWLLWKRKRLPPAAVRFPLLILGLSGIFLFNSVLYAGLRYTTAVNATLINSFSPVIMVFLSGWLLKERVSWRQFGGAFLSLAGIALIVSHGKWQNLAALTLNLGDVLVFTAAVIWSFFSIYSKKVMQVLSPVETVAYSTLTGLPFLWVASWWESHGLPAPVLFTWPVLASLIYLGIFASVLAFFWWYTGIRHLGAARAANFYNLIPVYAMLLAVVFLRENVFFYQAAGGILVIGGVFLSARLAGSDKKEKVSRYCSRSL
ncbi:MAG: DMT family transporter [Bacillota bacterium]